MHVTLLRVEVGDGGDAPPRRDVDSDEMRRVHPDLPQTSSSDRLAHLHRCDDAAYEAVRDRFPLLTPPHRRP
jgi:hypothetical protein